MIRRVLKGRQLGVRQPHRRIRQPSPDKAVQAPVDLDGLRRALDSPNPGTALLTALLAFHAVLFTRRAASGSPTSATADCTSATRSFRSPPRSGSGPPPGRTTAAAHGLSPPALTCSCTPATRAPCGQSPRGGCAISSRSPGAHPPGPHPGRSRRHRRRHPRPVRPVRHLDRKRLQVLRERRHRHQSAVPSPSRQGRDTLSGDASGARETSVASGPRHPGAAAIRGQARRGPAWQVARSGIPGLG